MCDLGSGVSIPGADLLANVAAEGLLSKSGVKGGVDLAAVLDGLGAEAELGIEEPRFEEGICGAGFEAASAGATMLTRKFGGRGSR